MQTRQASTIFTRTIRSVFLAVFISSIATLGFPALASAQTCQPTWAPIFGSGEGLNGDVDAMTVFDDGAGPALYVGGFFPTAGGVQVNGVAKWDGLSWSSLGSGFANGGSSALTVFDDGSGAALYAGGNFNFAGGVPANGVAKWDGQSWSPLGSGISGGGMAALTVFDDGSGPALYAGGNFTTAGGVAASGVAKWDGQSWSPLGSGIIVDTGFVNALAVYDDGSGSALYAAGRFDFAGGVAANNIARWDGQSWAPLGSGVSGFFNQALSLTVFDDGSGAALYVGGQFITAGGVQSISIAKWDGQSWSGLAGGVAGSFNAVDAMTAFDDGSGSALYASGGFTSAGGVAANNIARWDGSSWSALGSGISGSPTFVRALTVFDDGSGPALFAGGTFTTAGGAAANNIAEYQGCAGSSPSADLNGDGVVDGADLAALLTQWGTDGAADLNGDGVVNGADLAQLLTNWGPV